LDTSTGIQPNHRTTATPLLGHYTSNHTAIPKHPPCKVFVWSCVTISRLSKELSEGEQDRQCAYEYNVAWRRVLRATIVTVEKQWVVESRWNMMANG